MLVRCSSHGGFPKPTISGALNNESAVWNDSEVSESSLSLYNVTAKLWVSVTKDINFTCSVEYSGFAKSTTLLLSRFYNSLCYKTTLLNLLSCLWESGRCVSICSCKDDSMTPPMTCTHFKSCETAGVGEESYNSTDKQTGLYRESQLGWEVNWIPLRSGDVGLSGSHSLGSPPFSTPLYEHSLAASCVTQTWYSSGGAWEICVS